MCMRRIMNLKLATARSERLKNVLHSLLHTFDTRQRKTGADAFTIMKLMGYCSVTVSQKYVHPSSESLQLAIERMGIQEPQTALAGRVQKARKS